mmetsp:Transcript_16916/g.52706  ORF Transcript_16916/g.52706 Transcript_16916/m.52706 type:complete len:512 (+) Transcript_16916:213-1748(+)
MLARALGAALVVAASSTPGDGPTCVNAHNRCWEWSWYGECDRNVDYMRSSCALACGACARDAAGGSSEEACENPDDDAVRGIIRDPQGKWASGPIKNALAAMDRTPNPSDKGVYQDVEHRAPDRGELHVYWMGDGGATTDTETGQKLSTLAHGKTKRLATFLGHVFRVADDQGATLATFRVLPHRPTYRVTEDAIANHADAEVCVDADASCPQRAARGECLTSPGWTIMKCSKSCNACHLRDPEVRCPRHGMNVRQTPGARPGDIGALFSGLSTKWPEFNVTIHSRPGGDPEHPENDVADGPWVATLGGFVSEAEGAAILGTVSDQFERSTDQGKINRFGEKEKVVSKSRTSENAWCTGKCYTNPATRAVARRIQDVTGVPTENYEKFQVLRYTEGQQYRTHHDMNERDNAAPAGPRLYTFFLYLSDVEEGGETEFPLIKRPSGATVKVTPRRGTALIWPSVRDRDPTAQDPRTRHAALPVIEGVKFAANAWIHMFDYEQPNVWGCTGAFD